jgi:hypothetical protein
VMPFQVRSRSPCRDAEPQSKSTKSAASLYLRQHDSPTVDPDAIRRAVISTVRETALTVIFRSRLHEMSKVVCTAIAVRKGNDERTIRGPQGILHRAAQLKRGPKAMASRSWAVTVAP